MPLKRQVLRCKGQLPPFILGEMSPESDAGERGSVEQRTTRCRTAPDSAESPFSFPKGKGALLVYKAPGSIS